VLDLGAPAPPDRYVDTAGVREHTGAMDVDTRTWLQERIDGRLAAGVAVAWFVLVQVAVALEPVTHQPEPAYGILLELVMWLLLATMVAGLVMQRRWGLVSSLAAASFFTALSVACPVSGHHPFGAWWFGQMACALGLIAASLVAIRWSSGLPDALARSGERTSDLTPDLALDLDGEESVHTR
jgi:peptidoglycan/LPS O-acetylase OafA/YrhL